MLYLTQNEIIVFEYNADNVIEENGYVIITRDSPALIPANTILTVLKIDIKMKNWPRARTIILSNNKCYHFDLASKIELDQIRLVEL